MTLTAMVPEVRSSSNPTSKSTTKRKKTRQLSANYNTNTSRVARTASRNNQRSIAADKDDKNRSSNAANGKPMDHERPRRKRPTDLERLAVLDDFSASSSTILLVATVGSNPLASARLGRRAIELNGRLARELAALERRRAEALERHRRAVDDIVHRLERIRYSVSVPLDELQVPH